MVGKRDPKGKIPMRRVSIAPEGDYSPPPSPGPSNFGRKSSQGSPVPSHISFASQSRSRLDPSSNQPAVSVPSTSATSAPATAPASAPAATSAAQIPANRFSAVYDQTSQPYGNYWRPVIHSQGVFGAPFTQFGVAAQQPPTPSPVNPPDELGPPPPPPPPPAIPPVINPHGVHFQPQVPGTELGPMIHRYVPRHDPYGAAGSIFPGLQLPTYMANGATMPMQSLSIGVASATAPMNPIVVQQPGFGPMMMQNHSIQGGVPLMLPTPTQGFPMTGIPSLTGVPTQPPVHVEPAMGVGLTPNETIAQNMRIAQNNQAYEPQDFKPADPNPYRMYWFRELDGHWALFHRRQIDRLDVRWYRTDDGVFYAIRLSE
ncbi:hypothetical protein CHGG_02963 [Chaetomium globosum CBS 148.51]|uniref:Uncharacterized protein n=1 Tax=Chaetomium globosum (strain ATCC 6205 / CBS 148.51 / DSM 1962 / NBRC 6347 / NRRL 1970) TaxID=306901 RepID=Q2H9Z1_CHAGB|nr:uncharacterized protein CHGG_02963 [Chaetomium globosum CBS 148.51]EAQ91028.1 hypothetical protein CHGG_02963 [Chaetomium globosum CBS 148.51]